MGNAQNNSLFQIYANAGLNWPFALSALSLNAMSIPGIFMNFAVIWVTIRYKTLHGTANYLLALCSLFEMLHESGHLLFLWIALSGQNFLQYWLAVRICTISLFGLGCISPSMAFTGLDRMLCILVPTFPRIVKPAPYLGAITAICCGFGFFMLFNMFTNDVDPNLMITGTIGDINQGSAGTIYSAFSFPLYNATILLYVFVGILIKYRAGKNAMNSAERKHWRLFRSLFIIIAFNLGGYYFMRIFRFIVGPEIKSPVAYWFTMQAISVFLNLSAASNGPILFFTSKDYENAFRTEFAKIFPSFGINVVLPAVSMFSTAPAPSRNLKNNLINVPNATKVGEQKSEKF